MAEAPELRPTPLRSRRDAAIQVLCAEFAQDNLTLEEFERRLDLAHRATALDEIDALVHDLRRPDPVTAPATIPHPTSDNLPEIAARQFLVAVMGGADRRGRWLPARETSVLAVMGGAVLDFREALLAPGVTEVNIACCMGGVEIIVPPGLAVDTDGVAIMGGFVHMQRDHPSGAAGGPILKVRGFALMGGVEIYVREPGESAKDARRRDREQRKLRRGQ